MAFQKSNVNFQFQAPNLDPNLIANPAQGIQGGLESLFNSYMQMQQNKRAEQSAGLQQQVSQQQLAAGQRTTQDAEMTRAAQFGPRLGQEDQAQAIGQAQPGFMGPVNPKFAQFVQGLQAIQSKSKMASQEQQLGMDKTRSEIDLNKARADAADQEQVYVDPDTGKQIVVPRGAKLIPRPPKGGKMATNQDLNSAMELYETAKQGLMEGLGGSETGAIMGRMPAVTAKQQIAKGSVAAMAPVLKQIFRTAGEGVFTDRDQQLLLDMIPTRTELPEARTAMIANIDAIVKAKIKSGIRNAQTVPGTATESAPINLTGEKAARLAELRAKRGR